MGACTHYKGCLKHIPGREITRAWQVIGIIFAVSEQEMPNKKGDSEMEKLFQVELPIKGQSVLAFLPAGTGRLLGLHLDKPAPHGLSGRLKSS